MSPTDQMCKDFGFKNYAHLIEVEKKSSREKYNYYDFKWRLKMANKYSGSYLPVKFQIIGFFTLCENYVMINFSGGVRNWPKKAIMQYEYLFERLVNPWKIIKHRSNWFSIKDPKGTLWFKALNSKELFIAMDICYTKSKKSGAKVKPWTLSLKSNECISSYKLARGAYSVYWGRKYGSFKGQEYDIALCICDNIISTWDTKTGTWKPWNNKWYKLAHKELGDDVKYGRFSHHKSLGMAGSISKGLNRATSARTKTVTYSDISNWVSKKGLTGLKQAAFIIGVAFSVGGSTAAKIITSFKKQYNIKD